DRTGRPDRAGAAARTGPARDPATGGPRRGGDQRRPVRGGLICRNDRSVCREQTNRRFAPIGGQAGCMTTTEPLSYRDQLADRLFRQRILRLTGEVDDE